jgi:hypothetical protein
MRLGGTHENILVNNIETGRIVKCSTKTQH